MRLIRSKSGSALHSLVWLFFLLIGFSNGISAADPDFPALTGRVVDAAGILSSEQANSLNTQLENHETETSNQVVVATVSDLQGYSIADYGNRLARHWGIGQRDKDNGVVLLVAPNERKVRIEVGYGLEGALTDATSADIIRRQILPNFREDDYPGGIQKGIDSIISAIQGEYTIQPATSRDGDDLKAYGPLPLFAAVLFLQVFMVFGDRKIKHSIFPAGFSGIMAMALSRSIIAGLLVAVAMFGLLYFIIKPGTGSGGGTGGIGPTGHRHHRSGRSGGGFSGGGGSFGGGGASGSW